MKRARRTRVDPLRRDIRAAQDDLGDVIKNALGVEPPRSKVERTAKSDRDATRRRIGDRDAHERLQRERKRFEAEYHGDLMIKALGAAIAEHVVPEVTIKPIYGDEDGNTRLRPVAPE